MINTKFKPHSKPLTVKDVAGRNMRTLRPVVYYRPDLSFIRVGEYSDALQFQTNDESIASRIKAELGVDELESDKNRILILDLPNDQTSINKLQRSKKKLIQYIKEMNY